MRVKNLILVLLAIVVYLGIIGYVRISNDWMLDEKYYRSWRHDYVKSQGREKEYVNAASTNKTLCALSEAQGYGMLLAVKAAKKNLASQQDFQKLDNYYLANRLPDSNLMAWKQEYSKKEWKSNLTSASDGDMLIAQALLRADKIWPGHGYKAQACRLIKDISKFEVNDSDRIVTVGNWVDKRSHFYNMIRTSDVMPKAFEEFYQATKDKNWLAIKGQMLSYLNQLSTQHKTGLVPDFAWIINGRARAAKANDVASSNDGYYGANACRVPMLLAESNDKQANQTLKRMLKFFKQKGKMSAGFTLTGDELNHYQSASFSAPIFMAACKYRNQGYDTVFEHEKYIFSQSLPNNSYYDATLTVLAALSTNELTGIEK